MKGRNTLILNKATVKEAMKEFLDRRFKMLQFNVEDVKARDADDFEVIIAEIEPSEEE
jgi:hypothetical protein